MLRKMLMGLVQLLWAAGICCAEEQINIIPTPKEMKSVAGRSEVNASNTLIVLGKNANSASILGAEEINRKMRELNCTQLSIIREDAAAGSDAKNLIIIGTVSENGLAKKYLIQSKETIPDKKEGYVITSDTDKSRTVYLLSGRDQAGVLYACITFRQLLRQDKSGAYALNATIRDWPDYTSRGIFIATDFKQGHEKYLPYLDWVLYHKCNFVVADTWSVSNGNLTVPSDPKIISEIKKFNDYAEARGIEIMDLMFYWNIGYIPTDKGKAEFKGCSETDKSYWCFSRDELIKAKAEKIAAFLKNANCKRVLLHSKDGSPTERWNERCADCKSRFGEDRAGADANFINISCRTIKKEIPDCTLIFVVEPYYGNIDIPENKPYKEYFGRLTKLIPEDVYLVNSEWDRESQDSWKKVVRQPILHWRNIMIDPCNCGIDFSTMPSLSVKSGYYPGSRDIAFPNIHIGPGILEIFPLMSAEFMWNVDAPGCFTLHSDTSAKPEKSIETLYAYPMQKINNMSYNDWRWHESTEKPVEVAYKLLPRICEEAFGNDAAEMMSKILRMGVAKGVLLMTGAAYNSSAYYNTFHNPAIIKDQYQKAEKAVEKLTEYKKSGRDFKKLETFLRDMRLAAVGGKSHYHMLAAEEYLKTGKTDEAQAELKLAVENLKNSENDFKKWEFSRLDNVSKSVDSLSFRINILAKAKNKKNSGIKVGIYNPNEAGGKVYGEMPIYSTLLNIEGITPEFISSLDNIIAYDCIIIPDCKKFAAADEGSFLVVEREIYNAEKKLRDYVMKDGRGVLFYHDSVGMERFATGRPVFPELCTGTQRVDSTRLVINAEHPVTRGMKKGEPFEHMYFDHIQITPGEQGTVIVTDKDNMPVVTAAKQGKGRVILNGTIILNANELSLKEVSGIDRELLINSVLWLTGKNN